MTAQRDDLDLDVRFTETGVNQADGGDVADSADCTGDGCGGTEDSAGVTC